ncbi:MAG: 3-hydroxyacyl-CoA dehydrogenase NAD-binding domain-containing protein [Gemmatimonadetes bacterium]|nr:3-hydroxyacyl-CoA dehydrogenase NAD-binding domain-containing protein [Gemmatimonadota bacterium]
MTYRGPEVAAIVGAGVVGRSWIRVYARAGFLTRVHDPDAGQLARAIGWAVRSAEEDVRLGFLTREEARAEESRILPCETLGDAVAGAGYVQESGPEAIATKRAIYRELDRAASDDVILASSTSANDMSVISEGVAGAHRCIVAHPVNPPHVIPVVEVLPGEKTDPRVVAATLDLLRRVGMLPVEMNRFVPGFLLNRMQAAVVREAISLVGSGVASPEAVEMVMRDGLGLRWALMGPFGTGHSNSDGGVGRYYRDYGDAFSGLWGDLDTEPDFGDEVIDGIAAATRAAYGDGSVPALSAWRDRMIRRILRLKREDPPPG